VKKADSRSRVCWFFYAQKSFKPKRLGIFGHKKTGLPTGFFHWVEDGVRTHDLRNHNPAL